MSYWNPTILVLKQQKVEQTKTNRLIDGESEYNYQIKIIIKVSKQKLYLGYQKNKLHDNLIEEAIQISKNIKVIIMSIEKNRIYKLSQELLLTKCSNQNSQSLDRRRNRGIGQIHKEDQQHSFCNFQQKSIEKQKKLMYQVKRTKINNVQLIEFQSKYNYQLYWADRVKNLEEEQKIQTQVIQIYYELRQFVNYLEQKETLLLRRLQQNKSSQQFLQQYLEDASKLIPLRV
ncbi:unnamed protein product [Paramecium sonneborni]|uniref:Uncharacterized protein n=1 Tax=Paramecium sonneborni TaxID=65129 RepID=A0A8S1RBD6_9CILI|nr:unnamed protein product [Paramecium sonneborni]